MLLLISPAKTLDYESPLPNSLKDLALQAPVFPDQTATLIKQLKKLSVTDLSELMSVSQNLAELNSKRFKDWRALNTDQNSRPSLFAFNGDVYDGLAAKSLKKPELTWLVVRSTIMVTL